MIVIIVDIVKSSTICAITGLIIGGITYGGTQLNGIEYSFTRAFLAPFFGAIVGHYGVRLFLFLKRVRK